MSLTLLVSKDQWQEFDDAWKERMVSEDPLDELLEALALAGDKKRIARCIGPAKDHATQLEALGRHADAARVLGAVLVAGGNPSELSAELMRTATAAWAKEPWWESYKTLTGLDEEAVDLRAPWRAFSKLCRFQPGTIVYHPGGWGAGEIGTVSAERKEMDVRFASGKGDTFPMNAAIDIFEPLPESDLRAMYFRDPEGLRKRAKKEPLEILRKIVETQHGKATTAQIRNALMGIGIEGSAWSAWWRKARKLAETSEWFEVAGTPQKSVISLLLIAKDPSETLRKQLVNATSVGEVHSKVRDLFIGKNVDARLIEVGLEVLEEAAQVDGDPLEDRLAAWLFLRERRDGKSPEIMKQVLADVQAADPPPDPSTPSELWKLFQALPGVKDQERSAEILPELFGEDWLDVVLPDLQHAAGGQVRPLVDRYKAAGRKQDLLDLYSGLLARPLRAPSLLVTLAAMFEKRELKGDVPTPAQRAQALINLANHLNQTRRGNPQLTRVCTRLTDLLTGGKKPLLRELLANADLAALRSITMMISRGVDDPIDHMLTDVALDKDRDFFAADAAPFWQGETIWVTRAGLERRSAELRELKEVKIPANQDAIGRAASFGDLSENSEWEAAIEEQRNLTNRAMEMEDELRRAELVENAAMPEDTACPGTIVHYKEEDTDIEHVVLILGPWDADNESKVQIVSYRAPLAAGLLGRHAGDKVTLKLPSGDQPIEILSIEDAEVT